MKAQDRFFVFAVFFLVARISSAADPIALPVTCANQTRTIEVSPHGPMVSEITYSDQTHLITLKSKVNGKYQPDQELKILCLPQSQYAAGDRWNVKTDVHEKAEDLSKTHKDTNVWLPDGGQKIVEFNGVGVGNPYTRGVTNTKEIPVFTSVEVESTGLIAINDWHRSKSDYLPVSILIDCGLSQNPHKPMALYYRDQTGIRTLMLQTKSYPEEQCITNRWTLDLYSGKYKPLYPLNTGTTTESTPKGSNR